MGIVLVVVAAFGVAGCGAAGTSVDPVSAKAALEDILTAAVDEDFAKAAPQLDVADWMGSVGLPQASEYATMTPEERKPHQQSLFNAVRQVPKLSTLRNRTAIHTAVAGASAQVLSQMKVVYVSLAAADAEKPTKTITWKIKMRLGLDGKWRLAGIDLT